MKTNTVLGKTLLTLNALDMEVEDVVMKGNRITFEDSIVLVNNTEDGYAGNFRVRTYDAVERFEVFELALQTVVQELVKLNRYHPGATVEKEGNKYMLVPHRALKGAFYLLDLSNFEVSTGYMERPGLYRQGYTIVKEEV